MRPVLQAIGVGLSAFNAVNTVRSWTSDTTAAAAKTAPPEPAVATPSPTAASAGGAGALGSAEIQYRFLKLLVTQMRNQDPLNPLDNAQVTTQLAQISTVSGVDKLNSTVQGLSSTLLAAQSLQSASMIGRQVLSSGARLALANGSASGGVDLKQPAERVTIAITGAAGNVVRRIELGPQAAGVVTFKWDGLNDAGQRAADGPYGFQVLAARGNVAVAAEPLAVGRVSGIAPGADGTKLNIDGGGDVSLADVRRIF